MKNPYNFTKMERWVRDNGEAYVGWTEDGKYVSFDVRNGIPIFTGGDKVGSRDGLSEESYKIQRQLYSSILIDATITELKQQSYQLLCDRKIYKFIKTETHRSPLPTPADTFLR